MKIIIQSIHFEAEKRVYDLVRKKLDKLGETYDWILNGTVFLKIDKNDKDKDKVVEIKLSVPGPYIYADAREESFDLAINSAIEGVRRQLKKLKEKFEGDTSHSIGRCVEIPLCKI